MWKSDVQRQRQLHKGDIAYDMQVWIYLNRMWTTNLWYKQRRVQGIEADITWWREKNFDFGARQNPSKYIVDDTKGRH